MLLANANIDASLLKALQQFNIRTVEQLVFCGQNKLRRRALLQVIDIDEAEFDRTINAIRELVPKSEIPIPVARRYGMGYRVHR